MLPSSAVDLLMKVAAQLPKVVLLYTKGSYKPDLPIPGQAYTVCAT